MKRPLNSFTVSVILVLVTSLVPVAALGGSENPAPAQADTVIYPKGSGPLANRPDEPQGPSAGSALLGAAFLLALGGVWFWVKRRHPTGWAPGRPAPKLAIAETRSLGNRQYLIVATYEGQKFLLGVCPGNISLLTAFDAKKDSSA